LKGALLLLVCIAGLPTGSQAASAFPCSKGSGAVCTQQGWRCEHGEDHRWPWGTQLKPSDCPPGTHLVGGHQEAACLPPRPDCGPRAGAQVDLEAASGWECVPGPDCPHGTKANLVFGRGWLCEPLSGDCPPGTHFSGMIGGDCAPADRQTCERLRGWKWTDGECELLY
jgi:hypothetical protein